MVENANVLEDAGVVGDSHNKEGAAAGAKKPSKDRSEDFDVNGDFLDQKAIEKSELLVKQEDLLPAEDLVIKKNTKEIEENALAHDLSKNSK